MNNRFLQIALDIGMEVTEDGEIKPPKGCTVSESYVLLAQAIAESCIEEVKLYGCSTVGLKEKKTYIDGFIDGTEQGYKDAVEQISEGLINFFELEQ